MVERTAAQRVTDLNPPFPSPPRVPSEPPPVGSQTPQVGLPPLGGAPPPPRPIPNYLLPAVPVTIFCCIPLGIPAVVYAVKVDGVLSRGGLGGAEEAFKRAVDLIWTLAFPLPGS